MQVCILYVTSTYIDGESKTHTACTETGSTIPMFIIMQTSTFSFWLHIQVARKLYQISACVSSYCSAVYIPVRLFMYSTHGVFCFLELAKSGLQRQRWCMKPHQQVQLCLSSILIFLDRGCYARL